MKRIVYITDNLLDDHSVGAIHISEVCTELANKKCSIVLYAPSIQKDEESIQDGYVTKRLYTPSFFLAMFYQFRLIKSLLKHISTNKPDIFYIRTSQLLFIPTILGCMYQIPILLEVNGNLLLEANEIDKTVIGRIFLTLQIFRLIEYINVRFASHIITVTPSLKDYLISKYHMQSDLISVVANGVNTKEFLSMDTGKCRRKLSLMTDKIYVGYIGSLYTWQGLRHIVEAASLVCNKLRNIKFLIIGNGEESTYIKSYIKSHHLEEYIELRSAVSHSLIPTYINSLDICLSYPSKFRSGNTSPFKTYEYLACSKPVISSDISGIKDYFGSTLIYVEAESPIALANTIINLTKNTNRRINLGLNGRKFIENNHSWNAVTDIIYTIIEKTVSSYKKSHITL